MSQRRLLLRSLLRILFFCNRALEDRQTSPVSWEQTSERSRLLVYMSVWLGTYCRRHDVVRSRVEVVRDALYGCFACWVMQIPLVVPQVNMLPEYERRIHERNQRGCASVCERTTPLLTTRFPISSAHRHRHNLCWCQLFPDPAFNPTVL